MNSKAKPISVKSVRKGSAGASLKKTPTEPPTDTAASPFASQIATSLGRSLSQADIENVRLIEGLFARVRSGTLLTMGDIAELGFLVSESHWQKIDLWPAPPKNPHELWQFIAVFAQDRNLAIPSFLRPITHPDEARAIVNNHRREREVQRWRTLLGNLQLGPSEDARAAGQIELRLRLDTKEALVEWRKVGAENWIQIKPGKFKDFDEKHASEVAPEVALLWQPLAQRARYGYQIELFYHDPNTRHFLNRVLRLPALHPFIVGIGGEPLQHPEAPLRWVLSDTASEADDYTLRLLRADDQPVPPLLLTLNGRPTLYLTPDTIFTGPPAEDRALDPAAETRIPAPSLETPPGIRFLSHLQAHLPDRLRSKVRIIPLRPRIQAELVQPIVGYDSEFCFIDLLALTPDDKVVERWSGSSWNDINLRISENDNHTEEATQTKIEGLETSASNHLWMFDRSALAESVRLLDAGGFRWDFARQRWSAKVTRQFPERFVPWLKSLPLHLDLDLRGELASFLRAEVSGTVKLDVQEAGIDWFDLSVIIDVSDTSLTQEEIKVLIHARGKWVRIANKGWRKLEFKLSAEEDEQLARLGLNPHELITEKQRLHALQLADPAAKRFLSDSSYERVHRRAAELKARVTPDVPEEIKAELRPYQKEGFHFLAYLSTNRFGGVLADDMGLGKTLQTLTWLCWLRKQYATPPPSLVVCPKSVADNWRAEVAKFLPSVRARVWGSDDMKDFTREMDSADLHIINYNQLRSLGDKLNIEFLTVILDEGQYIKNPGSVTTLIASRLKAIHRLLLSGTPIENKLLDLWSLMSFAMPGVLGTRNEFQKLFDAKDDPLARRRLAARVRPFLLRRTKQQVAKDLPERIEEDLLCELEGEQKTLYRAELKRAQQMLLGITDQSQLNKSRFNLLTSLLRLRQICCHPKLVKEDSKADSTKVEALLETIEPIMEQGGKVIVFSQFVEMLGIIKKAIAEKAWSIYYLAGDTENRGELVQQFQAHIGEAVFLISLKAGGFGLNLTAASYVVLFDPWWNPAVENQAIDRTHRIGQKQTVIAYRLLIKDSVEEKIRALQKIKSQLADDVLGEDKFAQALTLDDLRYLFAD
ncbi:MAG: DEAD/DEAH box helicase [Pedosphaera sp.]|nr:DEAD/DEAH box helicase [Pedosphaera sp.]